MFGGGHDSRAIANIFVGKSLDGKKQLTITQLVKLVYIAHGWTLGWTGKPLIRDRVEAWQYGPVVPLIYKTFRPQGTRVYKKAVDGEGQEYFTKVNDVEDIISNVYEGYSDLTPFQLTSITHRGDSPWSQYDGWHYHEIDNEDIEKHYRGLVEKVKEGNY